MPKDVQPHYDMRMGYAQSKPLSAAGSKGGK
jgi:hypothetical protein